MNSGTHIQTQQLHEMINTLGIDEKEALAFALIDGEMNLNSFRIKFHLVLSIFFFSAGASAFFWLGMNEWIAFALLCVGSIFLFRLIVAVTKYFKAKAIVNSQKEVLPELRHISNLISLKPAIQEVRLQLLIINEQTN